MTTQLVTGCLLVVLPLAYNVLFTILGRSFGYPDVLRQPTGQVLHRFAAGGSWLVLIWWGFAMTAVVFAPTVVLLSATLSEPTRPSFRWPRRSGCSPRSSSFWG